MRGYSQGFLKSSSLHLTGTGWTAQAAEDCQPPRVGGAEEELRLSVLAARWWMRVCAVSVLSQSDDALQSGYKSFVETTVWW